MNQTKKKLLYTFLLSLLLFLLAACLAPIPPLFLDLEPEEETQPVEQPTFRQREQDETPRQSVILETTHDDDLYYQKLEAFALATREFLPRASADEDATRQIFRQVAQEFATLLETGGSTLRNEWHFSEVLWPENGFYVLSSQPETTVGPVTYRLFTQGNGFEQKLSGTQHSLHLQYWLDPQVEVGSLILAEGASLAAGQTFASAEIVPEQQLILVKQLYSSAESALFTVAGELDGPLVAETHYTFTTFRLGEEGIENYYPLAPESVTENDYWRLTEVETTVYTPQLATHTALCLEINWQKLLEDGVFYYLDVGQTHLMFDIHDQPQHRLYLELVDGLYTPQVYEAELW